MIKRFFCFLLTLACAVSVFVLPSSADGIVPSVSAKGAVLIDASDCRILYEKNADLRLPMASTTKIMTAVVVLEYATADETVTIPPAAAGVEGSSIYLVAGERLTVGELLYALLLASANDAATALAMHVGGSVEGFAVLMNRKADELGLVNTHFENPHGLDGEAHYTTAYDLARLTAYALDNESFAGIVACKTHEITGFDGAKRLLVNHNRLLRSYSGMVGVKTGFTKKSGRCLVTAAVRDGLTLIAVTLGDPDDWRDHTALLDYGFAYYKSVRLCTAGEVMYLPPLVSGEEGSVSAVCADTLDMTLLSHGGEIESIVECERFLWEMLNSGELLGRVRFFRDGKFVAEVDLIAAVDRPAPEKRSFFGWIKGLFGKD